MNLVRCSLYKTLTDEIIDNPMNKLLVCADPQFENWMPSGSYCYKLVAEYVNWQEALDTCRGLNPNATLIRAVTKKEIVTIGKQMTNQSIHIIWLDLVSQGIVTGVLIYNSQLRVQWLFNLQIQRQSNGIGPVTTSCLTYQLVGPQVNLIIEKENEDCAVQWDGSRKWYDFPCETSRFQIGCMLKKGKSNVIKEI